uniref:Uncharacterized protein n=1 Tax=Helianthus annuus TaxID=4232 RepID=A0A251UZU1_HELAN
MSNFVICLTLDKLGGGLGKKRVNGYSLITNTYHDLPNWVSKGIKVHLQVEREIFNQNNRPFLMPPHMNK